jgi:hypothetical protein
MFCPSCGSEQRGQYCRSCGTDLWRVRNALEKPEAATASSISAHDEIGRAVAEKIREMKSVKDLSKVVEEVLPGIAEFLETPEEKRLRRIRTGVITAAIGLGAALAFAILGVLNKENGLFFVACLGLTTLLIGLGLLLNGWHFTTPQKLNKDQAPEPSAQTATDNLLDLAPKPTAQQALFPPTVTEHTTHQLPDSQPRGREAKSE